MRVWPLLVALLIAPFHTADAAQQASPFHNEDEWIVGSTARAVVDLSRLVASGSPAPLDELAVSKVLVFGQGPLRFTMEIGSRHVEVLIASYVWDPAAYVALARQAGVMTIDAGAGGSHDSPEDVVSALLNLKAETLQAENNTISAALAADPRDPGAHEAAAFLLGALALRESSGAFYDPRLILSRAAAHLAVAHTLRGDGVALSLTGQLADLTLQVVAGRPGPAVMRMDILAKGDLPPSAQSWIRALKRRGTLDWRVKPADGAPFVERVEYMRALATMLTTNESLAYLEAGAPERVPDWGWRTLAAGATVDNGQRFVDSAFVLTLAEALSTLHLAGSADLQAGDRQAALTAALNLEPAISSVDRTSSRRVAVIDDGTWGAFYQRHLAHVAASGGCFYRCLLASLDRADDFDTVTDGVAGRVPLWPIVRRLRAPRDAAQYTRAMTGIAMLLGTRPDLVPYGAWHGALALPEGGVPQAAPPVETWFPALFPYGTAFDPARFALPATITAEMKSHLEAEHAYSPWDPTITTTWSYVRCLQGCTPEEERANYAGIADYSLRAMRKFAYGGADPARSLQRLCDVSADSCDELSDWLRSRDRFEEAVAADERFVATARDRVGMSNKIEWLVRYYQRTGHTEDARRVAQLAADVYSRRGLSALAGFDDRAGDTAAAQKIYRQIYTRYDQGQDLLAFYLRHPVPDAANPDAAEYQMLMKRYFDEGLGAGAALDSTTPPARGLRVTRTSEFTYRVGFRVGDIVTAVDGVEMWTMDQYRVLYDRSFDTPLKYTVWRVDGYLIIEGAFRQYYYGVDLEAYERP